MTRPRASSTEAPREDRDVRLVLDLVSRHARDGLAQRGLAKDLRSARSALRGLDAWHAAGGITGFGLGPKLVQGVPAGPVACRLYVNRKLPRSSLQARHQIPREVDLRGLLGIRSVVALDVIEMGDPRVASLRDSTRPLHLGLSIGLCGSGDTGTIGAIVRSAREPGSLFVLSCCHVLAASGLAQRGDSVIQPGRGDGGDCPKDTCAQLFDWLPLRKGRDFPNSADLALARLAPGVIVTRGPRPCLQFATRADVVPHRTVLYRVGAQSGETPCRVEEANYRGHIDYLSPGGRRARFGFKDLLLVSGPTLDGDSGAALLTEDGALVGLHQARDPSGRSGVVTPAWAVPSEWGLSIAAES